MKRKLNALACLFPFSFIRIFLLNLFGNKVSFKAKIGWGIYLVNKINLDDYARIESLNFIRINKVELSKYSFIKSLNYIKGPINLVLGCKSGIARQNKIRRAYFPVTYGVSELRLGRNTFIVSNNFLDLTRSISFGDNSQLGGIRSEFWTHGYLHESVGSGRIRIDGEIYIGDNVYIGSRCLFNPGVNVCDSVNIGSNSVVSKSLVEPGMYVNQKLKFLKKEINDVLPKLKKIKVEGLIERVYVKR